MSNMLQSASAISTIAGTVIAAILLYYQVNRVFPEPTPAPATAARVDAIMTPPSTKKAIAPPPVKAYDGTQDGQTPTLGLTPTAVEATATITPTATRIPIMPDVKTPIGTPAPIGVVTPVRYVECDHGDGGDRCSFQVPFLAQVVGTHDYRSVRYVTITFIQISDRGIPTEPETDRTAQAIGTYWIMETEVTEEMWRAMNQSFASDYPKKFRPDRPAFFVDALQKSSELTEVERKNLISYLSDKPVLLNSCTNAYSSENRERPVQCLFWNNGPGLFARWLTVLTGRSVRLPTDVEWQRACQGVDDRNFPWGDDWQQDFTNGRSSHREQLETVGSHPTDISPDGVMGMAGFVGEWVDTGSGHVARGGSYKTSTRHPERFTCARGTSLRTYSDMFNRQDYAVGFRLVMEE